MSEQKTKIPWFVWPFWAIWRLVALIIELTGRLVAAVLGLVLMIGNYSARSAWIAKSKPNAMRSAQFCLPNRRICQSGGSG